MVSLLAMGRSSPAGVAQPSFPSDAGIPGASSLLQLCEEQQSCRECRLGDDGVVGRGGVQAAATAAFSSSSLLGTPLRMITAVATVPAAKIAAPHQNAVV